MSEIEIEGEIEVGTSEEAAYAEVIEKVDELTEITENLEENAVVLNGQFDDSAGFWGQVHFDGFTDDSVIVHNQTTSQNTGQHDISPNVVTQSKISYNPSTAEGELFTRMSNAYHELIVDGKAIVPLDSKSPNFTALGASAYNKSWGGIGVTAVTGRVQDMAYNANDIPTNYENAGANKTCGGFFAARRNAPYSQGHRGTSYTIALEAQIINAPSATNIKADGTNEYFGNADTELGTWSTWTNGFHEVVGGTRPVSAAIMINGFASPQKTTGVDSNIRAGTDFTLRNGTYNGIIIGASCMQIRGGVPTAQDENGTVTATTNGNSHETVGINTANWTQAKHGFYLLKHGYSGRVLKTNSAALFESNGAKFLNADGSMPFAVSANGTPYIDLKTGTNTDYYSSGIPLERPTDTTRARVGYLPSTSSLNVSSDGAIKFITSRDFSDSEAETLDFTMSNNGFYPSEMVNLGSSNYFWDNVFIRKGAINIADSEKYRDTSSVVRPSTAGDTEVEKLLTAWGNVGYKLFKFTDAGSKKHIGLTAQDIDEAFTAQGLNASNYGLYWASTNGNTTTYGVRYNECLAMECAYLRDQLDSVKARLTALENA